MNPTSETIAILPVPDGWVNSLKAYWREPSWGPMPQDGNQYEVIIRNERPYWVVKSA